MVGDAELGGVGLDGLDRGHEVGEIFCEGRQGCFELGARGRQFWGGGRGSEGADAKVGGEERPDRRDLAEDISVKE